MRFIGLLRVSWGGWDLRSNVRGKGRLAACRKTSP
jgi:hypothetical protein